MADIKKIPLVLLSQHDSDTKFAESIMHRANTFIIDLDKLIESINENKDIIDRLAKMPPNERRALGILKHRDIFMLLDYRRVFVRCQEIALAKSEFEILQLLLSQVGRVFTYGKVIIIHGGPGEGKTTFIPDHCTAHQRRDTTRRRNRSRVINVIYQTARTVLVVPSSLVFSLPVLTAKERWSSMKMKWS